MSGSHLWEYPLVAVWGYQELVDDVTHLERLIEGEPNACAVFASLLTDGRDDE